jgi:hypothetical protein
MSKRKVKSDSRFIELSVVHTVSKKDESFKKQIYARKWFEKDCITSVEEYVTAEDKVAKSRSIVFDKYSGRFYATWHAPEDIMKHLSPYSKNIGFKK